MGPRQNLGGSPLIERERGNRGLSSRDPEGAIKELGGTGGELAEVFWGGHIGNQNVSVFSC